MAQSAASPSLTIRSSVFNVSLTAPRASSILAPLLEVRRLGRSGLASGLPNGLRCVDTVTPDGEELQHLFVHGRSALEEPRTAGKLALVLVLLNVSG
jgi:hypothetical protein